MGKEFGMITKATEQEYIDNCWVDYAVEEGLEYAQWHIDTVNEIARRTFNTFYRKHDYDKLDTKDEARVLMYGRRYVRCDDDELDPIMQNHFIGDHVKMHEHHPEHWDYSIDADEFDESNPPHVDCSLMTDKALTELICDWSAVAISFGSDQLSWYKRTVGDNKRFGFTDRQKKIILNGLKKVADECGDLGCWIDEDEWGRLLADVKMDESVMNEKNYHVDGLPTDIGTLEDWMEDEDALMDYIQRVRDEELYDSALEDALNGRYSEEELRYELESVLGQCVRSYKEEYKKGTVRLYRALCLEEGEEANRDELGECWAHSLYGIENFLGWKEWEGDVKLFCAETPVDNIDWVANFLLEFDTYYDEDEYRVLDDSKVKILWEKDFGSSDELVNLIRNRKLEEKTYHEGLPSTIDDVRDFQENPSELRAFLKRISDEGLYKSEYNHILDQWYGESDEYIDNELKETLGGFLHEHVGTLDDKGAEEEYAEGTVSLYRLIGYNTRADVNMGRCWAKGLDGVCSFLDNDGETLEDMKHFKLIHASTPTDNINWVATLLAVLDGYCEERERRVIDDSRMDIIWVKDFDSYDSAYSYISENK